MIHEDAIPFLTLLLLAIIAGILGKRSSGCVTVVLFCAAGLVPLLSYASNAEGWPIPHKVELGGFFSGVPLIVAGAFITGKRQTRWNGKMVAFWIVTGSALCTAIAIAVMIMGLSHLSGLRGQVMESVAGSLISFR